ncbi:ASKHA domain-containing protein [Butyrivibrio sp. LC3010]|uniref:ASKHA domain-containing protein n=1 Tax=Butyrivibrio sp. LC3010 TaxID=1280680 RepID=UPI0004159FA9|nr:ASKHA domain-containing protein [Butyrivibrio sp. LC3010]
MKKKCELVYKGQSYVINEGTLLSELLIREGIVRNMPCGGMGRCGKCVVRFKSGASAVTVADRKFLSEEELNNGYRLSCRALIKHDAVLESLGDYFISDSENISVKDSDYLSDRKSKTGNESLYGKGANVSDIEENNICGNDFYSISIDIGTTTIAASLLNKGNTVKKTSTMNSQAVYGADVISRIQADCSGKAKQLQELVINDLRKVITELLGIFISDKQAYEDRYDKKDFVLKTIVIAGNTTMLHILMGDSCEGLGKSPYKPVRLSYPVTKLSQMPEKIRSGLLGDFGDSENINVVIIPGISAFVGADIVSGMYSLSFDKIPANKKYMLIDLGTNGEMAVADSENISVCSTAAGPVFEGGGISCGMAGVPGAIEHVTLDKTDGKRYEADITTIKNEEPRGICGSGVLELVSELCRTKLIDETGLLIDGLFDDGIRLYSSADGKEIVFSQKDIRAVQLAKAAIRSGIDSLLKAHGCRAGEIDKVFLAGGFSEHLDTEKIRYLNMFPEEFLRGGVIDCVGNTSLLGCEKLIETTVHPDGKDINSPDKDVRDLQSSTELIIKNIAEKSKDLVLAETDSFSEEFIEAMNFRFI